MKSTDSEDSSNRPRRKALRPTLAPFVFIGIALLSLAVPSRGREPLRMGVTDFPPWFEVEGEQVGGIIPDALTPIFADLGVELEMRVLPIARLRQEVETGGLDCRAMARTESAEPLYHFGSEPLYRLGYGVFARREDGERISIPERIEDLAPLDLHWGLVHGLSYTPELLSHLDAAGTLLRSYENSDNLHHLLQNRVDVVLAEPQTFLHLAEDEGVAERVVLLEPALISKDYFLACNRAADSEELLAQLDESLRKLRSSPRWDEILGRYLEGDRRELFQRLSATPHRP